MPIFPNQYAEKLNPKNEDKILLADSESGSAIKSVQAKKVADLVLPITNDSLANGAVTASKIANGAVTASKIANGAVKASKMETVLYNGTASRLVMLSGAYTSYSQLRITFEWIGYRHTIVHDTTYNKVTFPVGASGLIGGKYRVYYGHGYITFGHSTLGNAVIEGSAAGATYGLYVGPTDSITFSDTIGDIKITRVVGVGKIF